MDDVLADNTNQERSALKGTPLPSSLGPNRKRFEGTPRVSSPAAGASFSGRAQVQFHISTLVL